MLQQADILEELKNEKGRFSLKKNMSAYVDRHAANELYEGLYRGLGVKLTKLITKEGGLYFLSDNLK